MSGPIIFVVVGVLLCNGSWAVVDVSVETHAVHALAEITLALLLFADASRINPQDLRHSAGLPTRLLAFGLPLTFALGFGLAAFFTGLPWELAALVGAVLAPTDAALSASVVSDPSLPQTIRRSLNVESGLNDGIATPVVTALIAGAATVIGVGVLEDSASTHGIGALVDLVGGLIIGVLVGYLGGLAVARTRARGWVSPGGARIVALMIAGLAFLVAEVAHVNYFVAAFVGGLRLPGRDRPRTTPARPPSAAELSRAASWPLVRVVRVRGGASWCQGVRDIGGLARRASTPPISLTVVRMVPVAIAHRSAPGSAARRRSSSAGSAPVASPRWCSAC